MPLNPDEIRLELVRVVAPLATRAGLEKPDQIVQICSLLEEYVLDSKQSTGVSPKPRETLSRKKS
jgi:hypothetical protein